MLTFMCSGGRLAGLHRVSPSSPPGVSHWTPWLHSPQCSVTYRVGTCFDRGAYEKQALACQTWEGGARTCGCCGRAADEVQRAGRGAKGGHGQLAHGGRQAGLDVPVRAHVLGLLLAPHQLGVAILRDHLRPSRYTSMRHGAAIAKSYSGGNYIQMHSAVKHVHRATCHAHLHDQVVWEWR